MTEPHTPIFKWAGGKRFLTPRLRELLPANHGTYFEPFLGGGALFFALQPEQAILSDANDSLIEAYQALRDLPEQVIQTLRRWQNNESEFYRIRTFTPKTSHGRAARLLYLTTLSFNGIHRVNQQGEFNVPYGYKASKPHCEPDKILEVSAVLQGKKLVSGDFESIAQSAKAEDVVYFDPPYTVAHSNNGFVKYNAKIFSWADQIRLAALAEQLRLRGCHVLVSNADHPSIRELYPNFTIEEVERFSIMAASAQHRKRITECIFHTRKHR